MALLLLVLSACSVPCESIAAGPARDRCLHERVSLDPMRWSAQDVARFAGAFDDPLVRNATVLLWVRDNRGAVSEKDRLELCGILEGVQRNMCDRRLMTAHLTR